MCDFTKKTVKTNSRKKKNMPVIPALSEADHEVKKSRPSWLTW